MERRILNNKPLVEAIFEIRWELQEQGQGIKIDPYYKLLVGTLYDRIKKEYPVFESLPASRMPEEMSAYIVQHRFRKTQNGWPLVQIGPGIITLNSTDEYVWEDFKERIDHLIDELFKAYPCHDGGLKTNQVILKYLDAVEFDFKNDNILKFLSENLKLQIKFYDKLFENTGIDASPSNLDLKFYFPTTNPKGTLHSRFLKAKMIDPEKEVLAWETHFVSVNEEAPKNKQQIDDWVEKAHTLTVYKWFFPLIEGELLRRFE